MSYIFSFKISCLFKNVEIHIYKVIKCFELYEHVILSLFCYFFQQQSKSNRIMRTSQLHNQDRNVSFTSTGNQRYEIMKSVSNKRTPTVKPTSIVNSMRNNPSVDVLATDYKILVDNPSTPIEIATRRADRIKLEKLNKAVSIRNN